MKSMLSLTVSVVMGLVMAVAIGSVEAKTLPYNGSLSGSFVNTESDTDQGSPNNGGKASLSISTGKTNQGLIAEQSVGELEFSEEGLCPNGNPGFVLTLLEGTAHFVDTFSTTGDQLFGVGTSATFCFDPSTEILFASGTFAITGGTGKYAGATTPAGEDGAYEGTSRTLYDDGTGNSFGQFDQTFSATLILP